MKLSKILKEIRIKNVNNPQNLFPKDEAWFMQVSSDDYFKTTNELFRQGFKIVDILENGDFVNDSYLLVYDLQVVNWDYDDEHVQIEYAYAGYKEIKQPVNEIKIRNVNKSSHLPNDERWYVEIWASAHVDQVWELLKMNGFTVDADPDEAKRWFETSGNPSYLIHSINRNELTWDTSLPFRQDLKQIQLNEIKIRNVNNPQLIDLPKDINWYMIVDNDNVDIFTKSIKSTPIDDGFYDDLKSLIINKGSCIVMYNQHFLTVYANTNQNLDIIDKYAAYKNITPVNEIKIRNVNKPQLHFPKDKKWIVEVSPNNVDEILDTLENDGFKFFGNREHIYKAVRNGFFKDETMLLVYSPTSTVIDWAGSSIKHSYKNSGYTEIQTLNEIKIRNINNPNKFPTDQDWYVIIDRDNIDSFLRIAKEMYPDDGVYVALRDIVARDGEAIMFHDLVASEHGHQNPFRALYADYYNTTFVPHINGGSIPKISF